jgi:hypothetical protein
MKTFMQWHLIKIINPLGLFQDTHGEKNNYPNYPKLFFINIRDLPSSIFLYIKILLNGRCCITNYHYVRDILNMFFKSIKVLI